MAKNPLTFVALRVTDTESPGAATCRGRLSGLGEAGAAQERSQYRPLLQQHPAETCDLTQTGGPMGGS